MSLLLPLGLLGLLSIIVLILIYVIKPNFQQKRISSTYVWKLSLKYRKKRIPISRLSQILIFICQLFIFILCALLLAKPSILEERVDYKDESVVIIDASASMMVTEQGESRFERAVKEVGDFANNVIDSDGVLSIIVADYEAYFLAQRSTPADADIITDGLLELMTEGTAKCTFGSADIEGAVALAEQIVDANNNAKVYLYTATEYINKNGINVVSVAVDDEWNAAVLDCVATLEDDNFYSITVDVGCYGRSEQLTVYCDVHGVNDDNDRVERVSKTALFDSFQNEMTFTFTSDDFAGGAIYSFEHLQVYIEASDGFEYDNTYYYYGGRRETIKIQYASSVPNNFFETVCRVLRTRLKSKWDIEYVLLKQDDIPAHEGFDIYIYEHNMPDEVPTDGVVILIDPDKAPTNAGFRLGNQISISSDSTLGLGQEHAITKYVNADNITVSRYKRIISADGYDDLLYFGNDPVMLVKNEKNAKIVLCTFNLHYSSAGVRKEFPILMYNIFNYFVPSTLTDYAFEIGETLTLNARGEGLSISGPNDTYEQFFELPAQFTVENPGTYALLQTAMDGSLIVENFFVKVPNFESNITKEVDFLPILHVSTKQEYADKDLLVYFAAALFALMFIEWILQAREYFR